MNRHLIKLLQLAELNITDFAIHSRTEMSYLNRTFVNNYMMSYHKSGTGKLRVGSQVYELGPGSVIFIPPNLLHDQYKDTDDEAVILWWHFTYKVEHTLDVLPLFDIPYMYRLKRKERFEAVFAQFMDAKRQTNSLSAAILQKAKSLELLYLLLDEALDGKSPEALADGGEARASFLGLLCAIVQQPERTVPLSQMAAELHLHPAYVSGRFRELFGKSPIQLQRRLVIEKAKSLLASDPEMGVSQIAEALAFSEATNFIRLFKRHTGMTPLQYRRLQTNAD